MRLHRYWLQFESELAVDLPAGVLLGCGVTAWNYEDALNLVRDRVFGGNALPPIGMCIEDVNVSNLDEGHVLPNMGSPSIRGVWFPLGYEQ